MVPVHLFFTKSTFVLAATAVVLFQESAYGFCEYCTSTVLEYGQNTGLAAVTVSVAESDLKDVTRPNDGLYAITIENSRGPYALEFVKDGYQPMYMSDLTCHGRLEKLDTVWMAKTIDIPKLTDAEIKTIEECYRKARQFAERYHEHALLSHVRQAQSQLDQILGKAEKPGDPLPFLDHE